MWTMCVFHDSICNGFGDMWWTDKCTYFSSIDSGVWSASSAGQWRFIMQTVLDEDMQCR